MTATDRIRESVRVARTGDAVEHTAVLVRTDEAEALCDLADACRAWMTGNCTLGQAEHRMADALARLYTEGSS